MPKIIELTVEIEIERVTCPGVWLCQDGRVSLSVFALGTNYQTCLLPPMFPLMFKDVFYFRKRFQESCGLSNMCCLLKGETIYCELVQWCEDCDTGECTILAQYLGALNDVLFPSDVCSNDGVDLLMRRSKEFPGILSPKIEIATKVRIDEVWSDGAMSRNSQVRRTVCQCQEDDMDGTRQKQVCHTPEYHRNKCTKANLGCTKRPRSGSRSASHSQCSLPRKPDRHEACKYPKPPSVACDRRPRSATRPRRTAVYNVNTRDGAWTKNSNDIDDEKLSDTDKMSTPTEERLQKILLESRYIEEENNYRKRSQEFRKPCTPKFTPCVCEICKRYHELFHTDLYSVKDAKV